MPESKTIEIDEITSPKDGASSTKSRPTSGEKKQKSSPDPLSALGWKARLTIKATQWFMFFRSKSYGKWIVVPVVILAILLIIPLGFIAIIWFFLKSLFSTPRSR